jgi:hypothetical protein
MVAARGYRIDGAGRDVLERLAATVSPWAKPARSLAS